MECVESEEAILRLMAQPEANRAAMLAFLAGLSAGGAPAQLDCLPDNTDAMTAQGLLQVLLPRV